MRIALAFILLLTPLAARAEHTIAVVGLVHSHVWGHLKTMIAGKPARLVGVAETIPELTAEAQKRGVPANLFHADYRKMLDETKPEIVWAFVENNRHLEIARECAKRKIHIMFEKPLASTHKEAVEIRSLAAKNGIFVLTNYQMAWWPANYAARKLVEDGAVGKAWRLRGIVGHGGPGGPTGLNKYFFEWLTDPVKNGAGALVDFGCYNALWSLWYLGRPATVYAHVNQLRPAEFARVEDSSVMVLGYPNGVGIFEGSWDLPRSFQDLEVFGLGGSVYLRSGQLELRKGRSEPQNVPAGSMPAGMTEPVSAMVTAIDAKQAPSGLVGLEMNIQVVEILDAAKQSIRTGKAVRLGR